MMNISLRVIVALGALIGALIFLAVPASSTSIPVQTTTTTSTADTDQEQVKSRLTAIIRLNGYQCDTLTKWHPMLFSRGYEVYCDLYYSYAVEDKGGRWIVTVK
jgi:hypothetical protein